MPYLDVVGLELFAELFRNGLAHLVGVPLRCAHQPAVQCVAPPMVRAQDGPALGALLRDQLRAAVAADVVEPTDGAYATESGGVDSGRASERASGRAGERSGEGARGERVRGERVSGWVSARVNKWISACECV